MSKRSKIEIESNMVIIQINAGGVNLILGL